MNDTRNLKTAIDQTVKVGQHAQGTISYTVSPVHTTEIWIEMAKKIEDMGANSLCIKDMAGLLQPYVAYDLVKKLKKRLIYQFSFIRMLQLAFQQHVLLKQLRLE